MDHLIATQIAIQAHIPVFLWGPPGVGKSAVLEQIAEALDLPLWVVILSIREPSDQGGLPVVRPDGVSMHPPLWAAQLCEQGRGAVFWDEFNASPPTTQSSALRVIHGGYAGDLRLPPNTSHVAAGNRQVAGAYDLTAAIANRWTHIDWPLDVEAWRSGMVQGWPRPRIVRLPETWREGVPAKSGLVSAFIGRRPNLLSAMPRSKAEQGGPWPSGRQWERVAWLLAACAACGYGEKSGVARLLVSGCVGDAAAGEFFAWITNLDLRDPEEYLSDPLGTPLPSRQDQLMATLDSVAAVALDRSRKDWLSRYYGAWQVVGRILSDRGDVAIPSARMLARAMPREARKSLPPEVAEALPMLERAGIDFSERG